MLFDVKETELMVNLDRYSIMKPTIINNKHYAKWRSPYNIHLDCNPWKLIGHGLKSVNMTIEYKDNQHIFISENHRISHSQGDLHLQAALNLNQNFEEDGGFVCVPGFHHAFCKYIKNSQPI